MSSGIDPKKVVNRASELRVKLGDAIRQTKIKQLVEQWRSWEMRILKVIEEAGKRPEVAVALVGSTGAGKSTLINALLDARILPVSNNQACTAAISEIAFEEGTNYAARVEFISREAWDREVGQLLGDIGDAKPGAVEGNIEVAAAQGVGKAARDKLWAVYKPDESADPATFDPTKLKEPPEITTALKDGVQDVSAATLDEFRDKISQFLNSRFRFWPIVKAVKLRGPFAALRDGAKLIDLPGLNDPNEAREEVTKNYLKSARFVWIVVQIKRALTKDTWALIQSEDFLRQIIMDGRANALTIVGTASDDVDVEVGRDELRLGEDATEVEVVAANNTTFRDQVRRQLGQLAGAAIQSAGEDAEQARALNASFEQSRTYAVSAREYLRLAGVSKSKNGGLSDVGQTEIPLLRQHLTATCAGYGVEAHLRALWRQLDGVVEEIRKDESAQRLLLDRFSETTKAQRKEVESAVKSARIFLDTHLADARDRFGEALENAQTVLRERLKRGVERATLGLADVFARWTQMHWGTIRAVARRQGTYTGSSGQHDFPLQLSKPILDSITFAWADFFGDKINELLLKWTDRLISHEEEFGHAAIEAIGRYVKGHKLKEYFERVMEATRNATTEQIAQTKAEIDQKIETARRGLYQGVVGQIKSNMAPAFEKAAAQSGSEMKVRMIAAITEHARQIGHTMFDDAERDILQSVRSLNDWVKAKFADMATTVARHSNTAAKDLTSGEEQASEETVANTRKGMDVLRKVLSHTGVE